MIGNEFCVVVYACLFIYTESSVNVKLSRCAGEQEKAAPLTLEILHHSEAWRGSAHHFLDCPLEIQPALLKGAIHLGLLRAAWQTQQCGMQRPKIQGGVFLSLLLLQSGVHIVMGSRH